MKSRKGYAKNKNKGRRGRNSGKCWRIQTLRSNLKNLKITIHSTIKKQRPSRLKKRKKVNLRMLICSKLNESNGSMNMAKTLNLLDITSGLRETLWQIYRTYLIAQNKRWLKESPITFKFQLTTCDWTSHALLHIFSGILM